jgi:chaperonin GroEL
LRTGGGGGGDRLRGGVALLRAAKALDHLTLSGDETTGVNIVRRALEEPIRRIVENASFEGSVVVKKVKAASTPPQGFDAERNEYVDLMKAGIVDPTKGGAHRPTERGLDCV